MSSSPFYWFVLGLLAVWRVTHLLVAEAGPWNSLARIRAKLGTGFWADLLGCIYCSSLWVAAPFAVVIGDGAKGRVLLWLAFSGGASLLERLSAGRPAPAPYWKEEDLDVVLRNENPDRAPTHAVGD